MVGKLDAWITLAVPFSRLSLHGDALPYMAHKTAWIRKRRCGTTCADTLRRASRPTRLWPQKGRQTCQHDAPLVVYTVLSQMLNAKVSGLLFRSGFRTAARPAVVGITETSHMTECTWASEAERRYMYAYTAVVDSMWGGDGDESQE